MFPWFFWKRSAEAYAERIPPGQSIVCPAPPSPVMHRLTGDEVDRLRAALKRNAHNNATMFMDARDTSWRDGQTLDERDAEAAINAIHAIPCHY